MARLRKGVSYRNLERAYTRISKFKNKNYVPVRPNIKVVKFDMGDPTKNFEYMLTLITKDDMQLRHNAIESARQTANRLLEKKTGKNNYHFKILVYPHHVLRENPIASGAGADRMSTGMKKSFGKPIGVAAQVKKGQNLFRVNINKQNIKVAKEALKRAARKLPCSCRIVVEKIAS